MQDLGPIRSIEFECMEVVLGLMKKAVLTSSVIVFFGIVLRSIKWQMA